MYRRTVRGDRWIPSLTSSSAAIRSSPQVRFADAMSIIRCRTVAGTGGRPRGRDFNRQNNRYALRCHRMSVAGRTMVRIRRQSTSRDSAISAIRVASSARRAFTCRSTYKANCFFRNRFSAARWACDRTAAAAKRACHRRDGRRCGWRRENGIGSYRGNPTGSAGSRRRAKGLLASVLISPGIGPGWNSRGPVRPAKAGMFSGSQSHRRKESDTSVAWVASVEETTRMKPTDKAILGVASESPGRNGSEPSGGLDKKRLRRPSPLIRGEGSMTDRGLTEAACHSGGVVRGSTVTRTCRATGETVLVPSRNRWSGSVV